MDPDGPDHAAWEADQADRGEAEADRIYFEWEDAQAALIEDDPTSPQWVEGHVFFQARAGHPNDIVLIGSFFDTDNGPMRVRREHVIEMRDFLTRAIEGTLEPDEERAVAPAPSIDL